MRKHDRSAAKTYDEIVRDTVPDPDTSHRPTARQEQEAREGYHHLDADEAQLFGRVHRELANEPGVEVEVARDVITLRGHVADVQTISRIEEMVREIDGVGDVVNRLVVRP